MVPARAIGNRDLRGASPPEHDRAIATGADRAAFPVALASAQDNGPAAGAVTSTAVPVVVLASARGAVVAAAAGRGTAAASPGAIPAMPGLDPATPSLPVSQRDVVAAEPTAGAANGMAAAAHRHRRRMPPLSPVGGLPLAGLSPSGLLKAIGLGSPGSARPLGHDGRPAKSPGAAAGDGRRAAGLPVMLPGAVQLAAAVGGSFSLGYWSASVPGASAGDAPAPGAASPRAAALHGATIGTAPTATTHPAAPRIAAPRETSAGPTAARLKPVVRASASPDGAALHGATIGAARPPHAAATGIAVPTAIAARRLPPPDAAVPEGKGPASAPRAKTVPEAASRAVMVPPGATIDTAVVIAPAPRALIAAMPLRPPAAVPAGPGQVPAPRAQAGPDAPPPTVALPDEILDAPAGTGAGPGVTRIVTPAPTPDRQLPAPADVAGRHFISDFRARPARGGAATAPPPQSVPDRLVVGRGDAVPGDAIVARGAALDGTVSPAGAPGGQDSAGDAMGAAMRSVAAVGTPGGQAAGPVSVSGRHQYAHAWPVSGARPDARALPPLPSVAIPGAPSGHQAAAAVWRWEPGMTAPAMVAPAVAGDAGTATEAVIAPPGRPAASLRAGRQGGRVVRAPDAAMAGPVAGGGVAVQTRPPAPGAPPGSTGAPGAAGTAGAAAAAAGTATIPAENPAAVTSPSVSVLPAAIHPRDIAGISGHAAPAGPHADSADRFGRPAGHAGSALGTAPGAPPGAIAVGGPASGAGTGPAGPAPQTATAAAAAPMNTAADGRRLGSALGAGDHDIALRLNPPELGTVNVRVVVAGHDVSAWFAAPQLQVQHMISQDLPALHANLADVGYSLSQAWVGGDAGTPRQPQSGARPRPVRGGFRERPGGAALGASGTSAVRSGVSIYV